MPTDDELLTQLQTLMTKQRTWHEKNDTRWRDLQAQVDAIEMKGAERHATGGGVSIEQKLKESEEVQRLLRNKKGAAVLNFSGSEAAQLFERKTTITSTAVGTATTGVLQIDRIPGITPEARQALTVRSVLSARPTEMQLVDFVRVNAPMTIGSPQTEASDKAENAVTFESVSEKVRTLATWVPATKQILQDFGELAGFIQSSLPYYVDLEEELQLLSGDNTGENLHGLITQATAFNTSLLSPSAGWNKIDIIGRAVGQLATAKELPPTFVIMHTNDWNDMTLLKDNYGRYLLGNPQSVVTPMLFGKRVIPTTSIAESTFLVGSGVPEACEIRDRMEMQIEISTSHSDYFVKHLVAVRAEKRLVLCVKRPASYITGTFSSSPA